VALARILLARRYGVQPRFLSQPPDLDTMLRSSDAALIIGDPALRLDLSALPYQVLDFGEEWTSLTSLPMVYAVWAGRPESHPEDLSAAFLDSCRFGLAHLDEIVDAESRERGLPAGLVRHYLTRHIVFELGDREYQGMQLFLSYAAESDILVPSGRIST
jgi:predicted solute-binding protein